MQDSVKAFVEAPTSDNLRTVRSILVTNPAYDPYSDDLNELARLVRKGKHREAVAQYAKSLPNLLLSPRAHYLASEAAKGLGDQDMAQSELGCVGACIEGISATGDGSLSRPFVVARVSDEADFLEVKFHTRAGSQGLAFQDDKELDRVLAKDGKTYWFDVSLFFNRKNSAPAASPVVETTSPASKPVAEARTAEAPVAGAAKQKGPVAEPFSAANNTGLTNAAAQHGRDAYRAGHYDVAISALDDAIKLEPKNASILVDRGNAWYAKREYAKAVADFGDAIRLDPNYATAYSNRAFALSNVGEHEQAITDFNAAIRLQANFGRAYYGRGYAFQAKGMIDTAIADYDVAIGLDPKYAAAYESRSSAYTKKGEKELADADAAKASELRKLKSGPAASVSEKNTAGK